MPVIFVDPKYTSQSCSVCGYIDKRNRPDQATFSCVSCGFSASADTNAAVNIAVRAVVNQPNGLLAQGSAA
jgi:transposase